MTEARVNWFSARLPHVKAARDRGIIPSLTEAATTEELEALAEVRRVLESVLDAPWKAFDDDRDLGRPLRGAEMIDLASSFERRIAAAIDRLLSVARAESRCSIELSRHADWFHETALGRSRVLHELAWVRMMPIVRRGIERLHVRENERDGSACDCAALQALSRRNRSGNVVRPRSDRMRVLRTVDDPYERYEDFVCDHCGALWTRDDNVDSTGSPRWWPTSRVE